MKKRLYYVGMCLALYTSTLICMETSDLRINIPEQTNLSRTQSIKTKEQLKRFVENAQQTVRSSGKKFKDITSDVQLEDNLFKQYIAEEMFNITDTTHIPDYVKIVAKKLNKNPEHVQRFKQYVLNKASTKQLKRSYTTSARNTQPMRSKELARLSSQNVQLGKQLHELENKLEEYKRSKAEAGQVLMNASQSAYNEKDREATRNFWAGIIATLITTIGGPLVTYFATSSSCSPASAPTNSSA